MIKLRDLLAIVSVFVLFNSQAFAKIITDVEEIDSRVGYIFESADSRLSWTHDLSDQAFTPGTAVSATLSIEISDDYDRRWNFIPEFAAIVVGVIDYQDDDMFFRAANNWDSSLGVNSLVSLNVNGLLDVTVQGLVGDFLVGDSILEVTTASISGLREASYLGLDSLHEDNTESISDLDATSVPEPASLLLMSIGLLGLGATRMKKEKRV